MVMYRGATTLALALVAGLVGQSYAMDCSCDGNELWSGSGGDGSPLRWKYKATLAVSATAYREPAICYKRVVENGSPSDVSDVYWKSVNFYRHIIPAKTTRDQCTTLVGFAASGPQSSPLYFNISSANNYETTVLPPKSGWLAPRSTLSFLEKEKHPALFSEIQFDTINTDGLPSPSRIVFYSFLYDRDGRKEILYQASLASKNDIYLQINMKSTPDMIERVPFINRRTLLSDSDKITSTVSVEGEIEPSSAILAVYARNERLLALDVVGLYVPANGRKPREDETFWPSRVR